MGGATKPETLIGDLTDEPNDVVLLQETFINNVGKAKIFDQKWGSRGYWSFGSPRKAGVGVLVTPRSDISVLAHQQDSDGRVMSLLIKKGEIKLNILSIYAPVGISERKEFFEHLHEYFYPGVAKIIGGDFNCIDSDLDQFGHATAANKAGAEEVRALKSTFDLVDSWRAEHRKQKEFTWYRKDLTAGSRLDKFLVERRIKGQRKTTIVPCVFSDHEYVRLELEVPVAARQQNLWKFNSKLLMDKQYVTETKQKIRNFKRRLEQYDTTIDWWDSLKEELQHTTRSYARTKRRQQTQRQNTLTKDLRRAKRQHDPETNDCTVIIQQTEQELRLLKTQRCEGAKVRARAEWTEKGEKPTRYFFNLERFRASINTIDTLIQPDGTETTTQDELKNTIQDFYTELYTATDIDEQAQQQLLHNLDRRLGDTQRTDCEGLFTKDEIFDALRDSNKGKSPGKDGLTPEFYLAFWDVLGDDLTDVLNQGFHREQLSASQSESVVRLLFKKGDRNDLRNWRPVSLLNADYKIAAKALANRLRKVLDTLVTNQQTCGIPGREISTNLSLIRDVLEITERTGETGILVNIDQEKAFDRVDRRLLEATLQTFGFGPQFIQWIRTLYANARTQVICNGELTESIPLGRGVRQGCPLSPLLYVLTAEILSQAIQKDDRIVGFRLPGSEGKQVKTSQYADDTTVYIKTDRALEALFSTVRTYERASGAKANKKKTEAMWLGRWRNRRDKPHGLKWVDKLKILGIYFSNGIVDTETDNWSSKLKKLEDTLNRWRARELSLVGKALVVNIIGASKFWYAARVLTVPRWVIRQYEKLVWAFVWSSRLQPVARKTLICPVLDGGIGIFDFESRCQALRASSLCRGLDKPGTESWYMLKYFAGAQLARLRPEWQALRDNSTPSAAHATKFLNDCLVTLRGTKESSCKSIYAQVVKSKLQFPKPCESWPNYRDVNWNTLWKRVRDPTTPNRANDLCWAVVNRSIKVRDRLYEWGVTRVRTCATCLAVETITHCFLECPRIKRVWKSFEQAFQRLVGSFTVNVQTVFLLTFEDCEDTSLCKQASLLIKTILYWTWRARNHATFNNNVETSGMIRKIIMYNIRVSLETKSHILQDLKQALGI